MSSLLRFIFIIVLLNLSGSIVPEYYLDDEVQDDIEINKTDTSKTNDIRDESLYQDDDNNDDSLLKRRLMPVALQYKITDSVPQTSSETTTLKNNSNVHERQQTKKPYNNVVSNTINVFKDYDYVYSEDTTSLVSRQRMDIDNMTTTENNTVKTINNTVKDNGATQYDNNSIRYLADFYNLVPAISHLKVNYPTRTRSSSNYVWYVPEKYPCWELPILVGRLGQRKDNIDDVFRVFSGKLTNVIDVGTNEPLIPRKFVPDLLLTINKWCGAPPCFGDHTLCVFADKEMSSICDTGYKVNIPNAVEKISAVNTINSMRNSIANGVSELYSHLPTAADMKQIIYDQDLEEMARVWLLQCLPGYDPCSSLDNNYVTQLECTKSAEHCCTKFIGTEEEAECIPKFECFILPVVGCIYAWFANGENKLTETDVECGHASPETYNTVQLIWAKTNKIGCAYGQRLNGDIRIICNFAPGAPFFVESRYHCGLIAHRDITDTFIIKNNTEDVTDLKFLASLGIDLNEIYEINNNDPEYDYDENENDRSGNISKVLRTSDLDSLNEIYKPGLARNAFKDFSNGTMGLIARLVTRNTFIEEGLSKCDLDEPIYFKGNPASRCIERGRRYHGLCYDFADPTPGYRLAAILAPIALFSLILYDLFSGVMRQTNY